MADIVDVLVPDYLRGEAPLQQNGIGGLINGLKDLPSAVLTPQAHALNPLGLIGQAAGSITGTDPISGQRLSTTERLVGGAMLAGTVYGLGRGGRRGYQAIRSAHPELMRSFYEDILRPGDETGAINYHAMFGGREGTPVNAGQGSTPQVLWPDTPLSEGSPIERFAGSHEPNASVATNFEYPYETGLYRPLRDLTADDFVDNNRTGRTLRARDYVGLAEELGLEHPIHRALVETLGDVYKTVHADAVTPTEVLGSTAWELNKWVSGYEATAVERSYYDPYKKPPKTRPNDPLGGVTKITDDRIILTPDQVSLWEKFLYKPEEMTGLEMTALTEHMRQFAEDTSVFNDPTLSAHPLVQLKRIVPGEDGNWLLFEHANFHNDYDLWVKQNPEIAKIREARLARLDYKALAPVVASNQRRLLDLATPEEWEAGTRWYQEVNELINDDPARLIALADQGTTMSGLHPDAVRYVANWRASHPEISGDLLSTVTASVSGQMPWIGAETKKGIDWKQSNLVQATKVIDNWLQIAGTAEPLSALKEMDIRSLGRTTSEGGVFKTTNFSNVDSNAFIKAGRLLSGEHIRDVMYAIDPRTPSWKTRNFDVNIDNPMAWFAFTADRHFYAGGIGAAPSIEKPAVGAQHNVYLAMTNAARAVALERGLIPNQMQAITWEVWKRITDKAKESWAQGLPYDPGDGRLMDVADPQQRLIVADDRVMRLISGEGDLAPAVLASSIPTEITLDASRIALQPSGKTVPETFRVAVNPRTGETHLIGPPTPANLRAFGVAYPTGVIDPRTALPDPSKAGYSWSTLWARRTPAVVDDLISFRNELHRMDGKTNTIFDSAKNLRQVSAPEFVKFLEEAKELEKGGSTKANEFHTERSVEEWSQGFRMYVSENGKAGFAIDPSGDLTGVLAKPGAEVGQSQAAIVRALEQGARTLDAFEKSNPSMPRGLPGFYEKFGFDETWRAPWDDELAGKKHLSDGSRPDVVGMAIDDLGAQSVIDYYGRARVGVPHTELHGASSDGLPALRGKHAIVVNALADLSEGLDPNVAGSGATVHREYLRALDELGITPSEVQISNPHHTQSAFGANNRQRLTVYFDRSADLKAAWDVLHQFEGRKYNEPFLDRRAYVFGQNEVPTGTVPLYEQLFQGPDGSVLVHLTESGDLQRGHHVQTWVAKNVAKFYQGATATPSEFSITRSEDGQSAIYNRAVRIIDTDQGAKLVLKTTGLLDAQRGASRVSTFHVWVPPTSDIPVITFANPDLLMQRNPAATPDRILKAKVQRGGSLRLEPPIATSDVGKATFNVTLFERAREALVRAGVDRPIVTWEWQPPKKKKAK